MHGFCIYFQNKIFMQTLENKVAYITGGSKGIGLGIAKKLIDSGMRVAITSRHIDEAKKAAASLTNDDSKILAIESDVSSLESEIQSIKKVTDHFGQLSFLVATALFGHFASISDLTP